MTFDDDLALVPERDNNAISAPVDCDDLPPTTRRCSFTVVRCMRYQRRMLLLPRIPCVLAVIAIYLFASFIRVFFCAVALFVYLI